MLPQRRDQKDDGRSFFLILFNFEVFKPKEKTIGSDGQFMVRKFYLEPNANEQLVLWTITDPVFMACILSWGLLPTFSSQQARPSLLKFYAGFQAIENLSGVREMGG